VLPCEELIERVRMLDDIRGGGGTRLDFLGCVHLLHERRKYAPRAERSAKTSAAELPGHGPNVCALRRRKDKREDTYLGTPTTLENVPDRWHLDREVGA